VNTNQAMLFSEEGYSKLTSGNMITCGGPWGTVPELLFEKKQLIPVLQQLLASHRESQQMADVHYI
jgi:hypothetical protein